MIAVVGSNMMDLITYYDRLPQDGETVDAPDFAMGHGGKGANQAVAMAKLGSEVLMVSKVGDDAFGEQTRANFAEYGIDTTHVTVEPGPSGVASVLVDPAGGNRIIIVKGANQALTPADVQAARESLARCSMIVLQLEIALETVYATIALGNELGVPVLLNPAPATPDLDPAYAAQCTFLVPNESELGLLTGLPVESAADVEKAAGVLRERGAREVLVTLGARGSLRVTDAGAQHQAAPRAEAVDSTGAGDAFIGAFCHRFEQDGDVAAAVDFAHEYAADSVTRRGTQVSYADRSS